MGSGGDNPVSVSHGDCDLARLVRDCALITLLAVVVLALWTVSVERRLMELERRAVATPAPEASGR